MYIVKVENSFSGAHRLMKYKGKCEELHGHNWKVEVEIKSEDLDNIGMVVDFTEVKIYLKSIMSELDHKYLNDLEYFKHTNPTSENIAKYVYDRMSSEMSGSMVSKVTIWETATSSASYEG